MDRTTERWVLSSTILASSMVFIDGSALNVALPSLQADLHATGSELLWVVNGYLLMLAALILVGGSLGDRLGRKKVFMVGIGLFVVASLACGVAPSVQWLILARIVQGIGGALMIPGSLALINASIPTNRRGRAIGTWSAASTLVTVAGPILGGFLADRGLWRGVFLINFPLGIAALLALWKKVPESRDDFVEGPLDWPGALLVTIGLAGVTYGFIAAPDKGFGNPLVIAALLGGALALVAFVVVEIRTSYPMVPVSLFRSHTFTGTNLLTLFLYGALSAMSLFLSLNLIQVQGYSQTAAGFAFLPFVLLLTALSRWAGGLVDRSGPRMPLIVGPSLSGLAFFWLAFTGVTPGPQAYWWTFMPGLALFGVGMGLTVAPLTTSVMGSVPTRYSGTASGINNAVSRVAGVLAIAILGSLALIAFSNQLMEDSEHLQLSGPAHQALQAQAQNLAGADVPPEVPAQEAPAVEMAIKQSFADTFRLIMIICAALAWVSALMAALLVENDFRAEQQAVDSP